jgi:hypothetical protein
MLILNETFKIKDQLKKEIEGLNTNLIQINLSKDILENECTDLKINIKKLESDKQDSSYKLEEITSKNNDLNMKADNLNEVNFILDFYFWNQIG